jgi:hypothetical protein
MTADAIPILPPAATTDVVAFSSDAVARTADQHRRHGGQDGVRDEQRDPERERGRVSPPPINVVVAAAVWSPRPGDGDVDVDAVAVVVAAPPRAPPVSSAAPASDRRRGRGEQRTRAPPEGLRHGAEDGRRRDVSEAQQTLVLDADAREVQCTPHCRGGGPSGGRGPGEREGRRECVGVWARERERRGEMR